MIASDYASMYSHERCRHRTPAGRQCSAVVTDQRYPYCHRHVPLQPNDSEDLSAPLTEHSCQFLNAQGINYSLSALYHLLASGKISPRRAGTLAYISSLLLHSLTAIDTDRHPHAGAEDPAAKPAPVYHSEAQWALAMMTPPIVPSPTDARLNANNHTPVAQQPIAVATTPTAPPETQPPQTITDAQSVVQELSTAPTPSTTRTKFPTPRVASPIQPVPPSKTVTHLPGRDPLPPGIGKMPDSRAAFANEVLERAGLPCSP